MDRPRATGRVERTKIDDRGAPRERPRKPDFAARRRRPRSNAWNTSRRYYAAVSRNPADPRTLLGLFPVREDPGGSSRRARRGGRASECYLAIAASCDGVRFGPPQKLVDLGCAGDKGRVRDYPADGLVARGDFVYFYVHRDMATSELVDTGDLAAGTRGGAPDVAASSRCDKRRGVFKMHGAVRRRVGERS